jgi:hypothetical protein
MSLYESIRGEFPVFQFDDFIFSEKNPFPDNRILDFLTVGPFVLHTAGSFEAVHMYEREKILLEDYLLPEEGYKVIGNEDVCKFNGKDYYKYGGSCPVIFSGKEAVVAESMSDDTIRNLYGSVKISYCNDKGFKKKVTLCDPNIYNQICEYPYAYADGQPQKEGCFRNIRGKAVNPSDIANNVKYYINTGLPIQCEYDPDSCDSILQNDSNTNDVFIENSPNDCIKKYGTAVQTKLCNGEYNIPKYACYYPKNIYKFTIFIFPQINFISVFIKKSSFNSFFSCTL